VGVRVILDVGVFVDVLVCDCVTVGVGVFVGVTDDVGGGVNNAI
jgi:hypothetical protein